MNSKPIGVIVGESSPLYSTVLFDAGHERRPRIGMYLTTETEEGRILGIVEALRAGNPLIPEEVNSIQHVISMNEYRDIDDKKYLRGIVQWFSLLDPLADGGVVRSPTIPPAPSSRVYPAPTNVLRRIFSPSEKGWITIGSLLSDPDVPFGVNVDMLSRHLAILAVTGGGKSNTVCILAGKLVGELGGTLVVFDMHGEYSSMDLGDIMNVQRPLINPVNLGFDELKTMMRIPENAHNQERVLREAWGKVREERLKDKLGADEIMDELGNVLEAMKAAASRQGSKDTSTVNAVQGVLNRLNDLMDYYGDVLSGNAPVSLEEYIVPGKLNIIDLSSVDERAADAVVSHYLRRLLQGRKDYVRSRGARGYPVPVIAFIEEAHILVPSHAGTLTKYWASRIAREGRKFQVGIALVSQRPKNVDPDVLSQTNNKIILKIVEPSDLRYVQSATEQMSDNIRDMLPGLNPGEAVVVGMMTKLPAIVRIEYCKAKKTGGDTSLVRLWEEYRRNTGIDTSEIL